MEISLVQPNVSLIKLASSSGGLIFCVILINSCILNGWTTTHICRDSTNILLEKSYISKSLFFMNMIFMWFTYLLFRSDIDAVKRSLLTSHIPFGTAQLTDKSLSFVQSKDKGSWLMILARSDVERRH